MTRFCPKCGSSNITVKYHPRGMESKEFLRLTCECGHVWDDKPDDVKLKEVVEKEKNTNVYSATTRNQGRKAESHIKSTDIGATVKTEGGDMGIICDRSQQWVDVIFDGCGIQRYHISTLENSTPLKKLEIMFSRIIYKIKHKNEIIDALRNLVKYVPIKVLNMEALSGIEKQELLKSKGYEYMSTYVCFECPSCYSNMPRHWMKEDDTPVAGKHKFEVICTQCGYEWVIDYDKFKKNMEK